MSRQALLLIIGILASTACADEKKPTKDADEPDGQPTSFWMEKKMEYSQGVLRGLATGDFESIQMNATQLSLLNRVEGFIRNRNPRYRSQIQSFQRASDEIFRQAGNKNLEGVTLAFNQLTVSCVKCHQSLRDLTTTPIDQSPLPGKAKETKKPE